MGSKAIPIELFGDRCASPTFPSILDYDFHNVRRTVFSVSEQETPSCRSRGFRRSNKTAPSQSDNTLNGGGMPPSPLCCRDPLTLKLLSYPFESRACVQKSPNPRRCFRGPLSVQQSFSLLYEAFRQLPAWGYKPAP